MIGKIDGEKTPESFSGIRIRWFELGDRCNLWAWKQKAYMNSILE